MKITSEKQAKNRQQEALEILAEVREWVWEQGSKFLPDGVEQVSRQDGFWFGAFRVWYYSVNDAMRIMDAGWDDKGKPPRVVFENEQNGIVRLDSNTSGTCQHCKGFSVDGERLEKAINHYEQAHGYRVLHLGTETHHDSDGKPWHVTVAYLKP